MPCDSREYIRDALTAARLVLTFSDRKSFDDYLADPVLRSAVERGGGVGDDSPLGDIAAERIGDHVLSGETPAHPAAFDPAEMLDQAKRRPIQRLDRTTELTAG